MKPVLSKLKTPEQEARAAAALRENLRRRKAQQDARAEKETAPKDQPCP